MAFKLLGSRRVVGVLDTTGNNQNNWTVTFDPSVLNVNVAQFEIYKMVVTSATTQFVVNFNVFVDARQWDSAFLPGGSIVGSNTWDATNPLIMRPGEYLYYYFAELASDGTPPTVTIWLRYDDSLRENQIALAGS